MRMVLRINLPHFFDLDLMSKRGIKLGKPNGKIYAKEKREQLAKSKICSKCGKEKKLTYGFYANTSPLFSQDGRDPICKDCLTEAIIDSKTGKINEINLEKMMRTLDRPYFKDTLESSRNQFMREHPNIDELSVDNFGKNILGLYMKNLQLRQNRNLRYADSEKLGFMHESTNFDKTERERIKEKYADIKNGKYESDEVIEDKTSVKEYVVTPEILDLFGTGYTKKEYQMMERKYNEMKANYQIQTNIHKEALLTYVRFKVKEELATAIGNVDEAKKWYDAAQNAADKAKLTPKQLSKADLQGGITNFSDIFSAVEEANERIPIYPEFKYAPNDAVDFIIWCYINYERNLNGLPEVEYKEIYDFYDRKKKEYIDMYGDPYGIFKNDPTLENRPNVEKFITIPPEFRDE